MSPLDDFDPQATAALAKVVIAALVFVLWACGLHALRSRAHSSERAEFLANLWSGAGVYAISTATFLGLRNLSGAGSGAPEGDGLSPGLSLLVAFFLVDFASYLYHVAAHKAPLLWSLHVVHHSARYFNLSLGPRQSWVERLVVTPLCYALVLMPLASWLKVGFHYLMLGHQLTYLLGFLNHTTAFDRWPPGLRWLLINPIEHRVHHGVERRHFDCNYGFALSLWDRLFGTYRAPDAAANEIAVGVHGFPPTGNTLEVQAQTFVELTRWAEAASTHQVGASSKSVTMDGFEGEQACVLKSSC